MMKFLFIIKTIKNHIETHNNIVSSRYYIVVCLNMILIYLIIV